MSREYTNKLIELVEDCGFEAETVLKSCLSYMSEADVEDMMRCEGYCDE